MGHKNSSNNHINANYNTNVKGENSNSTYYKKKKSGNTTRT